MFLQVLKLRHKIAHLCLELFSVRGFKKKCILGTVLLSLSLIVSLVRFPSVDVEWGLDCGTKQGTFVVDDFDINDIPCMDRWARNYGRVEDIFCVTLPKFLPDMKNPCFYDKSCRGIRKLRCLPYFYIIGMDKSGSTDLHGRLTRHPLVMSNSGTLQKETQFWSWKRFGFINKRKNLPKASFESYLDMFLQTAQGLEVNISSRIITGDATPMDLWDFRGWPMIPQNEGLNEPRVLTPHFIKHIYKVPPKLIILLREPIERLYSDYRFLEYGHNELEFHQHVKQAVVMMEDCLKKHSRRFCSYDDDLYQRLPARIHLGCYSVFLQEWFRVFPKDAFLILRTTDYARDMKSTLTKVFNFLEIGSVPADVWQDILSQENLHITKKTGKVLPETRQILRRYYSACNEETAELLNDKGFLWND